MFAFITIGTNNLSKSGEFYDKILKSLSIVRVETEDRYIGYCKIDNLSLVNEGKSELIEFFLMSPFDQKTATNGNGTMIVFKAKNKKLINEFYNIALNNGATSEGSPGPRHEEHYYAYIRDLDNNKICVFCAD